MKKTLCLALVLVLALSLLTGCARLRRRREQAKEARTTPEADFSPSEAPGYTITDGSSFEGVDGIGEAQPTARPVETLSPEDLALAAGKGALSQAEYTGEDDDVGIDTGDIVLGTYDEDSDNGSTHASASVIDTNAYQFSAIVDENIDFTFNYPSHWVNVPGVYTICFRESVEEGDFPARVAITRKRLVHTPDDAALMDELVSYMKRISTQYDRKTFQTSTPDREAVFMGRRAFSNTYLAYWGSIEVKGFVVGCAVGRTMYVFHFCASYGDYLAMENMMQYMLKSCKITTE